MVDEGDNGNDGITGASCSALAGTQPLPALERLELGDYGAVHLAAMAPWVGQLTALTGLWLQGCAVAEGEALLYLPAQLRLVHLRNCKLRQLPAGLSRLSALEALNVGVNPDMHQLPEWLSQLRRLEVINVLGTGVRDEQPVLAHMPTLRCVHLGFKAEDRGVLNRVPHLYFGHSRWGPYLC